MDNGQYISGDRNIGIQNVSDATINITQYLGKSGEYKEMCVALAELKDTCDAIPDEKEAVKQRVKQQIRDKENQIEAFKKDVLLLAQTFGQTTINTKRINDARTLFEEGKFAETRAMLEAQEPDMAAEQDYLLKQQQQLTERLQNNAMEYRLLAQTTVVDYSVESRVAKVCGYYEKSIQSAASYDSLMEYANFLFDHNDLLKAEKYIEIVLNGHTESDLQKVTALGVSGAIHTRNNKYRQAEQAYSNAIDAYQPLLEKYPGQYISEIALIYGNLGILHKNMLEYDKAEKELRYSSAIYLTLIENGEKIYYLNYAISLYNLGILHTRVDKREEARNELAECLYMYREMLKVNHDAYISNVAQTLVSLGHLDKLTDPDLADEEFSEAINIYSALIKKNREAYLPSLAVTLNNVGNFYFTIGRYAESEEIYLYALTLTDELAAGNPEAYNPTLANLLFNMGSLYGQVTANEDALKYYREALDIYMKLQEKAPEIYKDHVENTLTFILQVSSKSAN